MACIRRQRQIRFFAGFFWVRPRQTISNDSIRLFVFPNSSMGITSIQISPYIQVSEAITYLLPSIVPSNTQLNDLCYLLLTKLHK